MLDDDQAKQVKELQKENARLKGVLADKILGNELLKKALEKNGKPCTQTRCLGGMQTAGAAFASGNGSSVSDQEDPSPPSGYRHWPADPSQMSELRLDMRLRVQPNRQGRFHL